MFMLFLQSLLWLLLATLLGALVGWFIRPFFCRDCDREMAAQAKNDLHSSYQGSAGIGGKPASGSSVTGGAAGLGASGASLKTATDTDNRHDIDDVSTTADMDADAAADTSVVNVDADIDTAGLTIDTDMDASLSAEDADINVDAGKLSIDANIDTGADLSAEDVDVDVDIDADTGKLNISADIDTDAGLSAEGADIDKSELNFDADLAAEDTDIDVDTSAVNVDADMDAGLSAESADIDLGDGRLEDINDDIDVDTSELNVDTNIDAVLSAEGIDTNADKAAQITGGAAALAGAGIAAGAGKPDGQSGSDVTSNVDDSVTDTMRPARLSQPKDGRADDLKKIKGVGPTIEKTLNTEGIYHFQQVADFNDDNVRWVDKEIAFPGRVHREDWIGQAKALMNNRTYTGYGLQAAANAETTAQTDDGMRPQRIELSTGSTGDDLKAINGIGPVVEETLNTEGIYYYRQIADFDASNIRWVDNHISFPGRVEREGWVGQAKTLLAQQKSDTPKSDVSDDVSDDMKPELLSHPLGGHADDLKRIKGIGIVLEKTLQNLGIYHYHQIAEFTTDNVKWVNHHIAFPGRIERENWIVQAETLALGEMTEYAARFDDGDTPYKD